MFHFRLKITSLIAVFVLALSGMAVAATGGTAPAVSGVNGSAEVLGGYLHDQNGGGSGLGAVAGSVTFPLGYSFGAQADAFGGTIDNHSAGGIGAHAFWRNPSRGLVGLTSSYFSLSGDTGYRLGVEGELYQGSTTFSLRTGWQGGEVNRTGYGAGDFRYYPTTNLMLQTGVSRYSNDSSAHLGLEWRPAQYFSSAAPGFSLFGDAAVGNADYGHMLGGLRYYFGDDNKTLIDRHRQDDPENMMPYDLSHTAGGMNPPPVVHHCFVAGTKVLMADGSEKAIEDVKVGDKVKGADGQINTVEKLIQPLLGEQKLYAINGSAYFVTSDHPFLTKDGWKSIDPKAAEKTNPGLVKSALSKGDVLITEQGSEQIASIKEQAADKETQLYNFTVSGNHSFLVKAAGEKHFWTVHNKCFVAGTKVLMADGSEKAIEDVKVGDKVKGADGQVNTVLVLRRPLLEMQHLYTINGSRAFVTDDQPFMTREGWKAMDVAMAEKINPGLVKQALKVGDVLVTSEGESKIEKIEKTSADAHTQLYIFTVSGSHTFFARDTGPAYLVHNK